MAAPVLLFGGELGVGAVRPGGEDDGVVAEAAGATGRFQDHPRRFAAEVDGGGAGQGQARDADVAGTATGPGHALQQAQEVAVVRFVHGKARASFHGFLGCESLGAHSRSAPQGVHFQARVVGDGGDAGEPGEPLGLGGGVLLEGVEAFQPFLFWGLGDARFLRAEQPQAQGVEALAGDGGQNVFGGGGASQGAGQYPPHLRRLVRVAGGQEELHRVVRIRSASSVVERPFVNGTVATTPPQPRTSAPPAIAPAS